MFALGCVVSGIGQKMTGESGGWMQGRSGRGVWLRLVVVLLLGLVVLGCGRWRASCGTRNKGKKFLEFRSGMNLGSDGRVGVRGVRRGGGRRTVR